MIFEPLDFISKLAALVPVPGANLTRFHGVFAPNSKYRAQIVKRQDETQALEKEVRTEGEKRAAMKEVIGHTGCPVLFAPCSVHDGWPVLLPADFGTCSHADVVWAGREIELFLACQERRNRTTKTTQGDSRP